MINKGLIRKHLYHAQYQKSSDIRYFQVLNSIIYVFILKEKHTFKSKNWKARATHGILVEYDGHSIYQLYVESQNKIIQVKNLQVFEDSKAKASTTLLNYKNAPTFQDFFLVNDNVQSSNHKNLAPSTCQADIPTITPRLKKKVKPTIKAKKVEIIAYHLNQKAKDIKRVEQSYIGQKTKNK